VRSFVTRIAHFASISLLYPVPCALCARAAAQQSESAPNPIAYVATEGVSISGSLEVANGKAVIGNNGAITAGDKTANITLARGGTLRLCATTTVHISTDRSIKDIQSSALMISLDRGALETSYTTGKYSDVLMTPDFRILISGPGEADVKIRVSPKGDTCLDNHGLNAPYITVSSLLDGGIYRVQPDQRVMFERGSLRDVVDKETEPCGCPPAANVADSVIGGTRPTAPGKPVGGPSSTPADTAFPLAQSEGLAPAPAAPTTPAVPPGQTHAQVTVPLIYNSDATTPPPAPEDAAKSAPPVAAAPTQPPAKKPGGFFHSIGHFFAKIFGAR
jgi:hypothetical protein